MFQYASTVLYHYDYALCTLRVWYDVRTRYSRILEAAYLHLRVSTKQHGITSYAYKVLGYYMHVFDCVSFEYREKEREREDLGRRT